MATVFVGQAFQPAILCILQQAGWKACPTITTHNRSGEPCPIIGRSKRRPYNVNRPAGTPAATKARRATAGRPYSSVGGSVSHLGVLGRGLGICHPEPRITSGAGSIRGPDGCPRKQAIPGFLPSQE